MSCPFGETCPTPAPMSAPTRAPVPLPVTAKPTPSDTFFYRAEGDSSFGYRYQDDYRYAHQLAFRRPGWSTWEPLTGLGPFCYRNVCYDVTNVCDQFGGTLLHTSVCSFPENVKVAGPSCWRGTCTANGKAMCTQLGGTTVGVDDGQNGPQWCIFDGVRSFIGPACYNDKCFSDLAKTACDSLNGRIWNDDYCIIDGYYTVIGPVCWGTFCLTGESKNKCENVLKGTVFANNWCVVGGCDKTVIGPLCSSAPVNISAQCFPQATENACNELGGVEIADRFCVLDGTKWTLVGPTVYERFESTGATADFCRELAGNLNGYFNNMETKAFADRFCLVKERLPTTTPICTDQGCNVSAGNDFCERFNGKVLSQGFMCSLCDSYRQVVGPMMWNGTLLEGNPDYCEGMFCAVPNRQEDLNTNLRCPQSDPVVSRCGYIGNISAGDGGKDNGGNGTDPNGTDPNGTDPNGLGGGGAGASGSCRRLLSSGWMVSTLAVVLAYVTTTVW